MENIKKEVQKAVNLYKSGNFSESEVLSKKLISNNPKVPFLYNLLGLILSSQKKNDEAIKCYEEGLKIKPDYAMIFNNLGTIYKLKKEYLKAEDLYKKAIQLDDNIPETRNNLGNLYIDLDKHDEAIKNFKKSIEINPKFYVAHYNLGIFYKSAGKFNESKYYFNKSIKLNPKFYQAHRTYSLVHKYKIKDDHIKTMEDLYNEIDKDTRGKMELSFSLGKAFEDIKNFKKAFKYFDIANKIRRRDIKFSYEEEKKEFSNIKKFFEKIHYDKTIHVADSDLSPIFILGMPRSGTTLVEQIVSSHTMVHGCGELNYFDNLMKSNFCKNGIFSIDKINKSDYQKIKSEYICMIKKDSRVNKFITDKLPINFKWIGFIKLILPNSKIIHCVRDSRDTCLSIYKNYFTNYELNYAYNIDELISFYNLYDDLMKFWKKKLSNDIIEIRYESLIKNPKKIIHKLINDCNLSWQKNCLKFYANKRVIKTASDVQARKEIYSSSVNSWKNYKKYLKNFVKLPN